MILSLVEEAVHHGARQHRATECVGIDVRTYRRWKKQGGGADQRRGPSSRPHNKLSDEERSVIVETVNSPEFRDQSPKQIVPTLATRGEYIGSESTVFRVLRAHGQLKHRASSRPGTHHKPTELKATGACQVWSWDITYLRTQVRGKFLYLYMALDVWSRKIVGWCVSVAESEEMASKMFAVACSQEGVRPGELSVHSDNGSPMKSYSLKATLDAMGVGQSFSRPGVSNDNPFSESAFRTLKYRPDYPSKPFKTLEEAEAWVRRFVMWYNTQHLHSSLNYVTPEDRHSGREGEILARRHATYTAAKQRHPERWSGSTRNWNPSGDVYLNPTKLTLLAEHQTLDEAA